MGHSRRGRLLPVVGRLPQCPESGRKVRASASVANGMDRPGTAAASAPLDHLLLDEATPFGPVPRAAKRQPHRMDT
jgi:hypothetical protein